MFGIEPDLLRSYLDGRSENESQQAFGALQRHAKLLWWSLHAMTLAPRGFLPKTTIDMDFPLRSNLSVMDDYVETKERERDLHKSVAGQEEKNINWPSSRGAARSPGRRGRLRTIGCRPTRGCRAGPDRCRSPCWAKRPLDVPSRPPIRSTAGQRLPRRPDILEPRWNTDRDRLDPRCCVC